jgi:hypothetical protein
MGMDNKIPANIQSLIKVKFAEIAESKRAEEKQQEQDRDEREQRQYDLIEKLRLLADESIREYPAHIQPDSDDSYNKKLTVVFDVPGLAPILAVFQGSERDDEKRIYTKWDLLNYRVPEAALHYDEWDTDEYAAYWKRIDSYNGYKADANDLDFPRVLLAAKWQANEYRRYTEEARQRNIQNEQRRAKREAAEKAQTQARHKMIELIEGDTIALQLVHLFLAIQEQREHFRDELDHAEHWVSQTEARYQRRLNKANAELEQARRDAEHECSRADDLSYDLEEAQSNCRR